MSVSASDSSEPEWHALETGEAISFLESDPESGLSGDEADSRLSIYGPNIIRAERRASPFRIFFKQFSNLMIGILLMATLISGLLGEIVDAVTILMIVFIAALLGFWQEFRAERALELLKRILSPTCTVIRDRAPMQIPVEKVVPGDILALGAGDRVSADARLLEAFNLQVDEAPLTGESIPVMKSTSQLHGQTPLAERTNMVFSGTTVVAGRGKGVVVRTGMRTEFGKIAKEVAAIRPEKTPLEVRMDEIALKLGRAAVALVAAIAIGGLLWEYIRLGAVGSGFVLQTFMFAVALAVAVVPEALPAIVTGSLAIGMRVMAKKNALVRRMPAVETLGSTQIICSDKTGTLTKGEMTVRQLFLSGSAYEVTGVGYDPKGEVIPKGSSHPSGDPEALRRLAQAAVLCNDSLLRREDGRWAVQGDATEGALVVLAGKIGVWREEAMRSHPRVSELPFSPERKRMTTIHVNRGGKVIAYMKGAPEAVLPCCSYIYEQGAFRELEEQDRMRILKANEEMAVKALRVLAIAERELPSAPTHLSEELIEEHFTFLGLVGMMDPPRPEAVEAVRASKEVGMKPIMITGDHKLTAIAVAKEMGIYEDGDLLLTGEELDKLSEQELERIVEKVSVYARVSPHHKLKIVEAWKRRGRVVAMTGDGVNDAPALRKADIGIAMGITGTDVTKEASDLVLSDDNFATIVKAIELGRWIYDNVKKYLAYLLEANFVEVALMTIASLIMLPLLGLHGEEALPLLPVHILYINLATDGLPAIALGFSPPDPDLMKRPPRPKGETVFTPEVRQLIAIALLVQTPLLTLGFLSGLAHGLDAARTRLFLMFIAGELAIALNSRSLTHSIFKVRPHKWLMIAIVWEILLITALLHIPLTRQALRLSYPSADDLAWVIGGGAITLVSIELLKFFMGKISPLRGRRALNSI